MEGSLYLKPIEGAEVTIPASDGKAVICDQAKLTNAYVDLDFKNWGLDKPDGSTLEIKVKTFEIVKDGEFMDFFCSVGINLKKLALTQSQIIEIAQNKKEILNQDGSANFFLLRQGNEYFVVNVNLPASFPLKFGVFLLAHPDIWAGGIGSRVILHNFQDA